MSARWAIPGAGWRRHSGRASYARTRCSESRTSRNSRTRSGRTCGVLAGRVHRTPDTARSRSGARRRTRTVGCSPGSTWTLGTRALKNRFAALHSAQRLRRSCRSRVDGARPGLRHDHALCRRSCNAGVAGAAVGSTLGTVSATALEAAAAGCSAIPAGAAATSVGAAGST